MDNKYQQKILEDFIKFSKKSMRYNDKMLTDNKLWNRFLLNNLEYFLELEKYELLSMKDRLNESEDQEIDNRLSRIKWLKEHIKEEYKKVGNSDFFIEDIYA